MDLGPISPQDVYEWATWVAAIIISLVLLFNAYLCQRMSHIPRKRKWKLAFQVGTAVCVICAVIRFIVVLAFFDDYAVKLALPLTSTASWIIVGTLAYTFVRYVEGAVQRIRTTKQSINLTEAVFDEVVIPLIRGEDVSMETVKSFQKASAKLAA